jgi:hypothetical protein
MAFEQRDNSGAISKNDKKTEPKHKDYQGSALIDGQAYWISGWIKDGKNGKFLSLAFELKKDQSGKSNSSSKKEADDEESMPF